MHKLQSKLLLLHTQLQMKCYKQLNFKKLFYKSQMHSQVRIDRY